MTLADRQSNEFFKSGILDNYLLNLSKEKNFNALEMIGHSKGGGEVQQAAVHIGNKNFNIPDKSKIYGITHNTHGLSKEKAIEYEKQQKNNSNIKIYNHRNSNEVVGEAGQVLGYSINSKL